MAKNISLLGADYPDVPAVQLPQTGGGTATFYDIKVIDNLNSDSSTDALSAKQGKELSNKAVKTDTKTETTDSSGRIFIAIGTHKLLSVAVQDTSHWCISRYHADGTLVYVYNMGSFTPAASVQVTLDYSYIS